MKKIYFFFVALILINSAMGQWFQQNSGITQNLNSVYFTDANTGYAVGDSGIIIKTIDGGTNWMPLNSGTSKKIYSVHFPEVNEGYAVGDSGTIIKTTNGGVNWEIQTSNTTVHLYSVHFPCPDTGYAAGGWCESLLLKTTNGGTNWTIITFDTINLTFYSAYFINSNTGYLVGSLGCMQSNPIILKTTNGGLDWNTQNFFGWGSFYSVCFLDANTGYAAGYTGDPGTAWGCLYKTTNGGDDWIQNSECIGYLYKSVQFLNADTGFITTNGYYSEGAILKTTNGGLNLNGVISPTFNYSIPLNSVYFTDAETGYVVGGGGTILKTMDGGGFPVDITKTSKDSKYIKIYPIPSAYKITIETSVEGHLSIQNLNGKELLNQPTSNPSTQIDITKIPSGVYFLRVTNEKTVQVGKFIKE